MHWRGDHAESIKLGEAIAVGILQEQRLTSNERRSGGTPPSFTFTRFEGGTERIEDGRVTVMP